MKQHEATRIAELFQQDLEVYLSQQLRQRTLHQVVSDLNEAALSKTNPNSKTAKAALRRLGFAD